MCFFLKAKIEECTSLPLVSSKTGGSSGLFFLIVPSRAIFLFSSSSARGKEVKKLSQVTVCPLSPSVISSTTLIPWLISACLPASLPVYTCTLQAYDVFVSHSAQTFRPYFAGFFGMYCRNPHLPLNGTKVARLHTRLYPG